jgi:dipeptidyl aminopeptidase/acylaminoacyl peptidase
MPRNCFLALLALGTATTSWAQRRPMRPEDLFRIEAVGAIAWSPDRHRAALEITRPGKWLDPGLPTATIRVVVVGPATLRTISSPSPAYVGFFGAAWSPDGRRLLYLSADTDAVVRPWLWDSRGGGPRLLRGLELADGLVDPPLALWSDDGHAVFRVRDSAAPRQGPLYVRINRDRNVADGWARARQGVVPAVTVLDSRGAYARWPGSRIVSVDLASGAVTTLAQGALHRPRLSADRRTLSFRRENPPVVGARASTFFGPEATGDAAYDKPNWGGETLYVDSRSGAPVPKPDPISRSDSAAAGPTLRVEQDSAQGTRLLLGRPGKPDVELWRGNRVSEVAGGRAERIEYSGSTGARLTGWLLYPPGYLAGRRLPIITIVYPGAAYGERLPMRFEMLNPDFEHPQLLAALGYGVLLPSMPEPARPLQSRALDSLTIGVLPLLDTLIARGIADSSRIAVIGQSAGGYATIGLITRTGRFRTAISSAGYAELASFYGAFYGEYRYGDGGNPIRAQLLRMLQFERGYDGADAPPWDAPERYRENSPFWDLGRVTTPLLLIQGESDFVPIQQGEAVFTALYRQDKPVRLVRYTGEGHTITARANVLDLWKRIEQWLQETMH